MQLRAQAAMTSSAARHSLVLLKESSMLATSTSSPPTHSLILPLWPPPWLLSHRSPASTHCQTQQPLLRPLTVPALAASDTSDHMSVAFIFLIYCLIPKRRRDGLRQTLESSGEHQLEVGEPPPKKEGIQKERRLKPNFKLETSKLGILSPGVWDG